MRKLKIGATIIYSPDFYIVHQRQKGIDNGEIGKLGLYGGQFDEEKDKNFRDTVSRELHEESGLRFVPESFKYEDTVFVKSERGGKEILTEAEIFTLNLQYGFDAAQFKHGKTMTLKDIGRAKALGYLTSVAAESFCKFRGV